MNKGLKERLKRIEKKVDSLPIKEVACELFNIVSNNDYDMNELVYYFNAIDKALDELEISKKLHIPMKPRLYQYGGYSCPNCNSLSTSTYDNFGTEYNGYRCEECGQLLDWEGVR
jgi:hypothetical protein